MSVLYVKYDKLSDKHSLGIVSEVAVAEAENAYREVADDRKSAELEQFLSRQRLAMALNRPGDIPSDLTRPDLPQLDRKIPELSALLDIALKNNLTLRGLDEEVRNLLIDKLTIPNPKYLENARMGRWNRGTPRTLRFRSHRWD